jgi:membrane-anchored protein YejM (alkaline phosphatase superfamily)
MKNIDSLIAEVLEMVDSTGLSNQAVARIADLHNNTLRDMRAKTWSPTRETLRKLQAGLELYISLSAEDQRKVANTKNNQRSYPPKPNRYVGKPPRPKDLLIKKNNKRKT